MGLLAAITQSHPARLLLPQKAFVLILLPEPHGGGAFTGEAELWSKPSFWLLLLPQQPGCNGGWEADLTLGCVSQRCEAPGRWWDPAALMD